MDEYWAIQRVGVIGPLWRVGRIRRSTKSGSDPAPTNAAEFLALMKAEYPRYAKLITQANLRID